MHSLLAAVTILVLASVARDQVSQAMTGWDPFARIATDAAASGE